MIEDEVSYELMQRLIDAHNDLVYPGVLADGRETRQDNFQVSTFYLSRHTRHPRCHSCGVKIGNKPKRLELWRNRGFRRRKCYKRLNGE